MSTALGTATVHPHSSIRRAQIERAAAQWRADLIDVSGSNRLLFFRATAACLDLTNADSSALKALLAGTSTKLTRLFPDVATRSTAFKAIKALAAKQREATEEYGVSVAFLAVGIATWSRTADDTLDSDEAIDKEASRDTRARPSKPPAAPVLLRALDIAMRPGATDVAVELTLAEPQLNTVLAHVLSNMGVKLDEETLLDLTETGGPTAVYDSIRSAAAEVPGFAITDGLVLGPFSYLKQPMVTDCADIEALIASDLVAALAGDDDAVAGIRTEVGDVNDADPDYKPVDSEYLILDADASQSFVVNAALAGRNLVIQGPPGTGKSQTIANVIASMAAEGKRVLFVAQKRAAITAVLDRLEGVGLADITLDLFASVSSRRYVADQLRRVLDNQTKIGEPVTGALHRALTSSRNTLVNHRNALHVRPRGWGITVSEALAATYKLPPEAVTPLRLKESTLAAWGHDDLDEHADSISELAMRGSFDPQLLTRPGWSVNYLRTPELVSAATNSLRSLRSESLPDFLDAIEKLANEIGVTTPTTWPGAHQLIDLGNQVNELLAAIPGAFDPNLPDATRTGMLAATDKNYRKTHAVKIGWGQRRKLRAAAHALLTPDHANSNDQRLHHLLTRTSAAIDTWVRIAAPGIVHPLPGTSTAAARLAELDADLARLQPALQNISLANLEMDQLSDLLAALQADQSRAQMPRMYELETALSAAGLSPAVSEARRYAASNTHLSTGTDGRWAGDRLRYAALHSVLDDALNTDQGLAGITGDQLDAKVMEFTEMDREHLKANAARIRRAVAARLKQVLDTHPDQHTRLKSEVTRKRTFTPVRSLFKQAPDVLAAVKPVWAMSPLQVSQLLPASHCFDVVIFDEASQVKPADAIPALLRAPQAIVAGDSRQLPPTEFFTKVLEASTQAAGEATEAELAQDAEDEDANLNDADNAPRTTRQRALGEPFTQDAESILFAFDRVLAGQSRSLLWHYRSRDERLIATSNAHVYSGSLTTFPAADGHDCLTHVVVPPSLGIKNGTNSPSAEVVEVVELVLEHARTRPTETLGVITFGMAHARRVEAALDAAFTQHPDLEAILDSNDREPFFVKNIERVQGDERDAIIVSIGYGKPVGAGAKMTYMWGPLLKPGGERRINVGISRARTRMALVTSFTVDDIPEDANQSAGFILMYRFLRFMTSGGTDLHDGFRADVPLNPFEMDVRDRLTNAGLDLVPQLGVGSYRLDFAARHPEQKGRYVLAIEADGANYHSGHIARERDRLRQRLLEGRGWTFHRIWSTDWFNNADAEVAAAIDAYNLALTADAVAHDQKVVVEPPAVESPAWHVAEAKRTAPRPHLQRDAPIDTHDPRDLIQLVRHVRSDGILRSQDDELTLLMTELGYARRGRKIVAALTEAQRRA